MEHSVDVQGNCLRRCIAHHRHMIPGIVRKYVAEVGFCITGTISMVVTQLIAPQGQVKFLLKSPAKQRPAIHGRAFKPAFQGKVAGQRRAAVSRCCHPVIVAIEVQCIAAEWTIIGNRRCAQRRGARAQSGRRVHGLRSGTSDLRFFVVRHRQGERAGRRRSASARGRDHHIRHAFVE